MTVERRSPRKPADRVLSIEMDPDIHAIVLNTSEDGLGFRALSPVTQSGTIRFWFSDQGQRVEANAEIAWFDATKRNGGLHFASVPNVIRDRIRHWTEFAPPPASVGAGVAPVTAQPKEFPLPSADPPPPPAAARPVRAAYDPPAGPPLPQPTLSGYVMFEDESQYVDSRTRFFPGLVTGAILSVILVAILFFVYGNQTGGLWTRVRAAIDPSSAPSSASSAPPAAVVPPPEISSASSPWSSSTEAPAASSPLTPAADESKTSSAVAPEVAPPAATDNQPAAASDVAAPEAAPGEAELARAQSYLSRGPGESAAAVRLLWAAVEKGNVAAVTILADLYARGDGVKKNCDQARVLLRAAAAKGSSEASLRLAQMIRSGGCG